jgi:hypothetical protein
MSLNDNFKPTIKVVSFKESGKYYSEHTSFLKPEHYDMFGFELSELIKNNDPSVRDYSGLLSAFNGSYYYVIEVDYGPKRNFCYFLMNRIKGE